LTQHSLLLQPQFDLTNQTPHPVVEQGQELG
jgi:hypothetical protein